MQLLRFIFFMIVAFFIAKVIGVLLKAVRLIFMPPKDFQSPVSRSQEKKDSQYVDYEDVTDKK